MPDPNLVDAVAEIQAILNRRDIMGVVFLASPTHTMHLYEVGPTWSCATLDPDTGFLRFRSKRTDYPSREAQKKTQENTVGSFLGFIDTMTRAVVDLTGLVAAIGRHVGGIEHISKQEDYKPPLAQIEKGKLLIIGLSKANMDRLPAEPIHMRAGPHVVPDGLELLLFVGETEKQMMQTLEQLGWFGPDTVMTVDPRVAAQPEPAPTDFPADDLLRKLQGEEQAGHLTAAMELRDGRVRIHLGKPCTYLDMTPGQASSFASALLHFANKAEGF